MPDARVKTLPPDRSHVTTEHRHDDSHALDALSVGDCVALMACDHQRAIHAVQQAAPALTAFIEALVPRMRAGGRLISLGAGTSGRLGVLDASECPSTFQADPRQVIGIIAGGDAALRRSSEAKEDDPNGAAAALDELSLMKNDAVLGITAGGTTPYVIGGLRHAKRQAALTGLLTCAPIQDAHPFIDQVIHLATGPELLTGSTRLKAGTATKLALNIISTTAFTQLGKVYSNLMVDIRATNDKLFDRALRILITLCPDLTRAEAAARLEGAGGELKTAILMEQRGLDADEAHALLATAGSSLRAALVLPADDSAPR